MTHANDRRATRAQLRAWRLREATREAAERAGRDRLEASGIDLAALDRWVSGEEMPSLEDVRALEDACDLQDGTLLVAAGYSAPYLPPCEIDHVITHDVRTAREAMALARAADKLHLGVNIRTRWVPDPTFEQTEDEERHVGVWTVDVYDQSPIDDSLLY